jgi:hypothetical protein
MPKPANPYREVAETQLALIEQIDGSADWYSDIGANATLSPTWADDPEDNQVYLASLEVEPTDRFSAVIRCTWQADVLVDTDTTLTEADVAADLTAALTCGQSTIALAGVQLRPREQGSRYASVTVSTEVHRPTQ